MYVATLPKFMEDIGHEFGWSRTAVAAGVSVELIAGIFAPTIGVLVDRFRPRNVILISTAIFGVTLAALGLLPGNYPLFFGLSFVLGLAGGTERGLSVISVFCRAGSTGGLASR